MLSARPNAINQKLPLDAPAMASTLSVDMVMSATTMYQMACQKRIGPGAASGGVLASISTLTAIHRISSPPAICRYGGVRRRGGMVGGGPPRAPPEAGPGAADDANAPFGRRQGAHRQRDHQRVTPRQQQVDQDNLEPAQKERHAGPVQALARRNQACAVRTSFRI